jgi:hypothetical protein
MAIDEVNESVASEVLTKVYEAEPVFLLDQRPATSPRRRGNTLSA